MPHPLALILSLTYRLWLFVRYTVKQFGKNRCILNAAALSYDTLLTIVPVLAISFSILASFHLLKETQNTLFAYISSQAFLHADLNVTYYLNEFIENTKDLDVLSYFMLLISTLLLFTTIEKSLNIIWDSLNGRSFLQRFLAFWSVISLGPLLLGLGIHLSTSFLKEMSLYTTYLPDASLHFLGLITPFCLLLFFLTLLYLIVPTYRVRFVHALGGALFAALAIEFFRHAFLSYIMFIPSYQIIYKPLAAVPLLIIWLYIFWIFVLYGAQLAACLPDWSRIRPGVSFTDTSSFDALENSLTLLSVLTHHTNCSDPMSKEFDLSQYMGLPTPSLERLLGTLQKSQLIEKSEAGHWFLIKDLKDISIYDLYQALNLGLSCLSPPSSEPTSHQQRLYGLLKQLDDVQSKALSQSVYSFLESDPPC